MLAPLNEHPTMTSTAIMQPTYLPWIGYFALMDQVDEFILLDSVQFAKRSWQQRNRINTAQGPLWLTVPVATKGLRDQLIADALIQYGGDFPRNHIRAIEMSYLKCPYFDTYGDSLISILETRPERLCELSVRLIEWIRDALAITTPLIRASTMDNKGAQADLLAHLCAQSRTTTYVSPPGSRDYLEASSAFNERNIKVEYFDYSHPEYNQGKNPFETYLSAIDLLFNEGPASMSIIKSGLTINRSSSPDAN